MNSIRIYQMIAEIAGRGFFLGEDSIKELDELGLGHMDAVIQWGQKPRIQVKLREIPGVVERGSESGDHVRQIYVNPESIDRALNFRIRSKDIQSNLKADCSMM